MMKITELSGCELKWIQTHAMKRKYELRAGEVIAATLHFRSFTRFFATGASGDGCWTFERIGFWQPKLTVRASGTETDLAIFKNKARGSWRYGGMLELPDGQKYLVNPKFWNNEYEFKTETGATLVRYKIFCNLLHVSSEVEIVSPKEMVETPWLILSTWYLTLIMVCDENDPSRYF